MVTVADVHSEQEKINYVITGREGGLTTLERLMGSTRLYWAILDYTGLNWNVLGNTALYLAVLGCSRLHWAALGCSGL